MAAVVGLSATGPVAGGLFATAQSAAMGGSVGPFAAAAAPIVVPTMLAAAAAAAGGAVAAEYTDSQQHTMGPPTLGALDPLGAPFVLVVHNWGPVEMRAFATEAAARQAFGGGRRLRRFVVRLHTAVEPHRDNGHGWALPWEELAFEGWGCHFDNEMRLALLARL